MGRKSLLVSAALVSLWACPLVAHGETLEEALALAYTSNPDLQAQRSALRATDEGVARAVGGWRPRVSVDGTYRAQNTETNLGSDSRVPTNTGVFLEQPVYQGGQVAAEVSRAEQVVLGQRARLQSAEQSVLLDAVTAYTNVLADRAVLNLSINNEERLDRQLQATRDRFEVGEVTRTDVSQAEARLSGASAERIASEGDLEASIATYRAVIGKQPADLVVPGPMQALPDSEPEARILAEEENPAIQAAAFDVAAARQDVEIALAGLRPRLSLEGELSYGTDPTSLIDDQNTAAVGARVSVPLYQGGSEYAFVRQSKQILLQRRQELDAVRREVNEEVTAAWEALDAASARIRSFRAQVEANRVALEGVRQEALVGARTVLDVLDAEQELFEAEVDLVRATRDQINASYRLKAAVGQLTVEDLNLPVDAFDVQEYYDENRDRLFGLGQPVSDTLPKPTAQP